MTAEFAVALPAVVLVLGVLLAAGVAVVETVRCVDAARAGARAAARHESSADVLAATRATAPVNASVTVEGGGEQVRVTVTAQVEFAVPGVPPLEVRGTALADVEDTGPPVGQEFVVLPGLCLLGRLRSKRALTRRRQARDRGAGTVLVLALVAVVLLLTAGAAAVGKVFVARHRAAAAADLAALAAAGASGDCRRAEAVAGANGARLAVCSASAGGVVDVTVEVTSVGGAVVRGAARAGPVEGDDVMPAERVTRAGVGP